MKAAEWAVRYKEAKSSRPETIIRKYGHPVVRIGITDAGDLKIETEFDRTYPEVAKWSLVIPADVAKAVLVAAGEWF